MVGTYDRFEAELEAIRDAGLYKSERVIGSPQRVEVALRDGREVLNFCANNYLGLADNSEVIEAARQALEQYGFGLASVRFICGTQSPHKQLELAISAFLGTEDTILYPSCFDANAGLFETLLSADDAIISDELNHASIIDGVRLCKAQRFRYRNNDMEDLQNQLRASADARTRLIATDGVFSMDGTLARLDRIVELAAEHDALVMIDESHATGFVGETGRGTAEHYGVLDRIDIITSTLGKALGGGSGGFTAARRPVVDLLRQRSRPYLFSNTVAPPIVGAALRVFEMLSASTELRDRLARNATYFRTAMRDAGFDIPDGHHPIVPVMLYDAKLAQKMAAELLDRGIYVIGFSYPVVPKDKARIRVQLSAAHRQSHLEAAVDAFRDVGRQLGVVPS